MYFLFFYLKNSLSKLPSCAASIWFNQWNCSYNNVISMVELYFPLMIIWQSSCTVSFLVYFFSCLIILKSPLLTRFWWQELLDLGEAVGTQSRGLSQERISLLPVTKYKCGFFSRKRTRRERSDRNLSFLLSSCLKICGTLIYIWCNVMVSAYHSRSGYEIVCSNFVLLLEWIWS